jgi:concanavalin A-like lectin/glucanase superfamily protein
VILPFRQKIVLTSPRLRGSVTRTTESHLYKNLLRKLFQNVAPKIPNRDNEREKYMKTKNKISAYILRTGAAALLFLCVIVALSSARADCVPPSGLVSWWPGDGNANDIVSGNNGTLQNGATFGAVAVGQAILLNNGSANLLNNGSAIACVQVPNSPSLNPTGSFSLDAWIFPVADGTAHIIAKWGDTAEWGNQRAYSFHTTDGRGLRFSISDDANQSNSSFHDFDTPEGVITLNAWNFVAAVYDQSRGTRQIYVNGVKVAERTDSPITITSSVADLGIGAQVNSPTTFHFPFAGLIEEVELFNRALSQAEIQFIYNAGITSRCKPNSIRDGSRPGVQQPTEWQRIGN